MSLTASLPPAPSRGAAHAPLLGLPAGGETAGLACSAAAEAGLPPDDAGAHAPSEGVKNPYHRHAIAVLHHVPIQCGRREEGNTTRGAAVA